MEAYCVKCKSKREIKDAQAVFLANGRPAIRGTCAVCGTRIQRLGRTPDHDGLPQPQAGARPAPKKTKRSGSLVIVESPTKAKTIGRFLGRGYNVRASVGHVRDLLRSQLSVDVHNGFTPKYRVPNEKREVVRELKAAAGKAREVYLATDPDREGEAIAWHLLEAAELDPERTRRVAFHEITRPAVEQAFAHPRGIDINLVNAQQARRILDRLVGYSLSPLLWAKVRSRLSAGRVQSVALRLVVERERVIQSFVPDEYWTVEAELARPSDERSFRARLNRIDDEEPGFGSQAEVQPYLDDLQGASFAVLRVKRGERRRNPSAPFTTSALQQEASKRLGFSPKKTMVLAQQLYEGVDLGESGMVGLVTYMRTDSTQVSAQAQSEAREYIEGRFGKEYLPEELPQYKTRTRSAQEAHEAIRPTSVQRIPPGVEGYLSKDQRKLYALIWQRFLASQMAPALYDTMSVEIGARHSHSYLLRASGATLRFSGYLAIYEEAKDEDSQGEEEEGNGLPNLAEDDALLLRRLWPEQHFTQPPPKFTEASLVRALEENGIGRPSTYAPILSTIQQRGYVTLENRRLVPTETGYLVNDLLVQYFPGIMDVGFTAQMEETLDAIAAGDQDWVKSLREFYGPFAERVAAAQEEIPKVNNGPEPIGRDCPLCGKPLVMRYGRYGQFIGCSDFPKCRHIEPWLKRIGVPCPKDGGDLVERRTRKGRTFYACANYPTCDFSSWKRPLPSPCPECGGLLVQANQHLAECTNCHKQFSQDELALEHETA
ncbi:MAG: type I DNA topoisomerase [Anaerolineales bacterium]